MNIYKAFLYVNCGTQLGTNVVLTYYTCHLVRSLRDFFDGKFMHLQRLVIVVTLVCLLISTLSLINDVVWTIVMSNNEYEDSDNSDGLLGACFVLWIPIAVINSLHGLNLWKNDSSQPTSFGGLRDSTDLQSQQL